MSTEAPLTIWTVGHSTRPIEEFLDLLFSNGIELVVDVRSLPGSRRYPQYNQEPLAATLRGHGIDYLWMEDLGGRRKPHKDSIHTEWRNKAFQAYADYMDTPAFREGMERVLNLATHHRLALMCAEAVWWHCHRRMIADYLTARGVTVVHIMGEGKSSVHVVTEQPRPEETP